MNCSKCQSAIAAGSNFCTQCGTSAALAAPQLNPHVFIHNFLLVVSAALLLILIFQNAGWGR